MDQSKSAFWAELLDNPARKSKLRIGVFAVLSIGSAMVVGYRAGATPTPENVANRAWHGKVVKIARAGAQKTGGVTLRPLGGAELAANEGSELSEGSELWTDGRTRVRIELDDGTSIVLDRATSISVEAGPRTLRLKEGAIVADVAHIEGAPVAHLVTPTGEVGVLGTKFALTSTADRTTVEVMRGVVELKDASSNLVQVGAGQEGVASKNAKLEIAPVNDLAQRLAFGEGVGLPGIHNEDAEATVSGLGELRARRPGKTDEKDHVVALTAHNIKVRIVGNVARTEVDETFTNETGDDLEGLYRFPLPPDAQIERLALEVDGKLVDGSFVDKAKGAAIFRGAVHNATPTAPKPKEEIIWVPGPWRDPALLEWQRGGRFELKIFPIPKRGSRRVVIAYTETIAPVAGVRRYVYPLPQTTSSDLRIGIFSIDLQVLGNDPKVPVKARGYELAKAPSGSELGGERFAQTTTNFVPSGDLAIEYVLSDRASDVTAWGYTDPNAPKVKVLGAISGVPEKGYVALALRPKLPGWTESRPRDVVLAVDAGRSMFGERYQRAKRLAVQVVQEMDRRDRIAVLACDVTCRAMPTGFGGAGSASAHDVESFLSGSEPDGASDLVGAVRSAAGIAGHDRSRDLRIVLVSDGVASAGYRRPERLAAAIKEALVDARSEVITVPVGSDADTTTLQEIARGGGGVVVPYAPGEMLETAALDVLNATYGVTLRDVTLTLPDGLSEVAPSNIAPMRAGGETLITARITGDHVKGDAILSGKVGGEKFEARYPLDVRATTEAGNAFVPRLYAAARISDKERDAPDAARAELVSLSQRYGVPSRFTSLLVLESEAMFTAFGIDRSARATAWTGEELTAQSEVATRAEANEKSDALAIGGDDDQKKGVAQHAVPRRPSGLESNDPLGSGTGSGFGGALAQPAPASPPADFSPPPTTPSKAQGQSPSDPRSSSIGNFGRRGGGQWMKRVWFRKASVANGAPPPVPAEKVAAARAALQAAPDERGRYRDLVRVLSANGALDELGAVLARWSTRDPLDADAISARADLAARAGDRERALRILDGVASGASSVANDVSLLDALALTHERAQDHSAACAFRIAAAETRSDVEHVARALACEIADGHARAFEPFLARKERADIEATAARFDALAKGSAAPIEAATSGDIVVDATWDAAANTDVDIAIVDPLGSRLSWAARGRNVRVADATSRRHEALAVSSSSVGAFTIEVTRAGGTAARVSGNLSIRAIGERLTVPFFLSGANAQVARVQVRMESELVPSSEPETGSAPPFDRATAARLLSTVSVASCSAGDGATGNGIVRITFAGNGRVVAALVDPPFEGTAAGRCVSRAYRRLAINPFNAAQGTVTMLTGFVVPP